MECYLEITLYIDHSLGQKPQKNFFHTLFVNRFQVHRSTKFVKFVINSLSSLSKQIFGVLLSVLKATGEHFFAERFLGTHFFPLRIHFSFSRSGLGECEKTPVKCDNFSIEGLFCCSNSNNSAKISNDSTLIVLGFSVLVLL